MKHRLTILILLIIIASLLVLYVGKAHAEVAPYDDPRHFYGIAWRDVAVGKETYSGRYAKAMGYKYIALRPRGAAPTTYAPSYYTSSYYDGLKFYVTDPLYIMSAVNLGFSQIGGTFTKTWGSITDEQKDWIKDYVAWNANDVDVALNLTGGWTNADGSHNILIDVQQARARALAISDVVDTITSYIDVGTNDFKFAGWMNDILRLWGDVHKPGNIQTTWEYYSGTGTESCIIHNGSDGNPIVHDVANFSDGMAEFYKGLNLALNNEYGTGTYMWGGVPWEIYYSYLGGKTLDEWVYHVSARADKMDLVPDFILSESNVDTMNFTNDPNNFNVSMGITRDMVGCGIAHSQTELSDRTISIACGTSGANYNYFGHFGDMGNSVVDVAKRSRMVRAIPGWLNRWEIPVNSTYRVAATVDGNMTLCAYRNNKLYAQIGKDYAYGRHPDDSNKIVAVFYGDPVTGSVTVASNENIAAIYNTNGFMEADTDASGLFTIDGNHVIPSGVTPDTNGAGFIIMLTPDTSAITASGSGSISTSGSGIITVE